MEATSDVIRSDTWPAPIRRERFDLTPREFRTDFARRLGIAEEIKQALRRRYALAVRQSGAGREVFEARSQAFWEEYEAVNLALIPEDPVYSKVFNGIALSTTNDLWELGAASAGQTRILESYVGGEAAAGAVVRFGVNRVGTQGTGTAPTSYTPAKFNTRSPAAAGTYYGALTAVVTWGTAQATLDANPMISHTFNAFGGMDKFVAAPGSEIYLVNAEYASGRSISGTSVVSGHVIVEEL